MEKSINLIGISGKKQSGKNLVANIASYLIAKQQLNIHPQEEFRKDIFYTESSWQQKGFAGPLKQVLSILTGIPVENFEKEEVKNMSLEELFNNGYITKETYEGFIN